MKKQLLLIALLIAGGVIAALAVLKLQPPSADAHGHGHSGADDHADEAHGHAHPPGGITKTVPTEGPHGGKLLRGEGFEVEVTIFEDDVPPEFRLYGYVNGQPIPPTALNAKIELQRLDQTDRFTFQPREDYLRGEGVVSEPHSFDVVLTAEHAGKSAQWTYESYEGRTTIAPEFAKAGRLVIAQAGPATLQETVTLHGVISADANRVSRVGARFPGIVKSTSKQLGDIVATGDLLAIVESNDSLQSYQIHSPQAGIVTERTTSVGAVTGDSPLFVITDLSTVWVELKVFASDASRLTPGLTATLRTPDGATTAEVVLTSFLPTVTEGSQTRVMRVPLDNADGRWTPGLRVIATVQLPPHVAKLAVQTAGLQSFRDFTVVFAQVGDTYEVRMLELGRSDGTFIEVLSGLRAGEAYVAANSFLVKADAMKSGASHDH